MGGGHALPLPGGGAVDFALDDCGDAGTCRITDVTRLGPFGDPVPPIPLAVANVPLCPRIRPTRRGHELRHVRLRATEIARSLGVAPSSTPERHRRRTGPGRAAPNGSTRSATASH